MLLTLAHVLTVIAMAVLGIAVLPWTAPELEASAGAWRALEEGVRGRKARERGAVRVEGRLRAS